MMVFALLTLAGCGSGSSSLRVSTDYDRSVDFSQYHTFAFQPGRVLLHGRTDVDSAALDIRIRNAVTEQLEQKGLQPASVPVQTPDIVITYVAGAQRREEIEKTGPELVPFGFPQGWYGNTYYGRGGWWGPGYDEFWVRQYTEDTLILDLIDAHKHQLIWRAYAAGEIDRTPNQSSVNTIAKALFKHYPPQPTQH
jgi:hypothetical protein